MRLGEGRHLLRVHQAQPALLRDYLQKARYPDLFHAELAQKSYAFNQRLLLRPRRGTGEKELHNDLRAANFILEDLSEVIASGDYGAGLHCIDLVIQCEHVKDTCLIPNNTLSLLDLRSIVSFNLLCQFRLLNLRKKKSQ